MQSRLPDRLASVRTRVGRRQPFWIGEAELTYGDLFDVLDRFVGFVKERGWSPGARVGLACRDPLDTALVFLGLVRCGITAVVLDPESPPDRAEPILSASELTGLVASDEWITALRAAGALPSGVDAVGLKPQPKTGLGRLWTAVVGGDLPLVGQLVRGVAPIEPAPVATEAPAYILFTSGSTARPKGVVISHRALCAQLDEFEAQWGIDGQSRILNLLPLHHTDGINMGPMIALWCGATVVRPFRFEVSRLPELLDQVYARKISHFVTVPSLMALALDLVADRADAFRTPELRCVVSTAAYLDPTLWARFQETFGVRVSNCYGLTETVSQILYCGPDDASWRIGTVGRPRNGHAKVVSDEGAELPDGEAGELWVRGDNLMSAYYRNPEDTAAALVDGWLRTGDLAVRDPDGFFRIVGRKKNVIISGGINVYPEEIDEHARSLAGVRDSATVGVPDRVWGERAVTCVVAAQGATVRPEEVQRALSARLAPEKRPWRVLVADDLPRGPSGKVVLPALREWAQERLAEQERSAAPSGPLDEPAFLAMAAFHFAAPPGSLSLASTPADVGGWSSLAHLELILALEKAVGREFETQEVLNFKCLGDMYAAARRA